MQLELFPTSINQLQRFGEYKCLHKTAAGRRKHDHSKSAILKRKSPCHFPVAALNKFEKRNRALNCILPKWPQMTSSGRELKILLGFLPMTCTSISLFTPTCLKLILYGGPFCGMVFCNRHTWPNLRMGSRDSNI